MSSIIRHSMRFNVIDEFNEYVKGADLRARQIERGDLNSDFFQVKIGEGVLNCATNGITLLSEGSFTPDVVTLGIMLDCQTPNTFNGKRVMAGDFGVFSSKADSIHLLTANTRWAAIQLQMSDIEALSVNVAQHFNTIHQQRDDFHRCFFSNINAIVDNVLHCDEEVLTNMRGDLLYNHIVTEVAYMMSKDQVGANFNCCDYFQSALLIKEYLRAYNAEIIQIADLCQITCKSLRTLERICHRVFHMSPGKLIKLHRLNAIRRAIISSAPDKAISLTTLSVQYGFMNTGRFAVEYRKVFGERPSDTLAKVRQ